LYPDLQLLEPDRLNQGQDDIPYEIIQWTSVFDSSYTQKCLFLPGPDSTGNAVSRLKMKFVLFSSTKVVLEEVPVYLLTAVTDKSIGIPIIRFLVSQAFHCESWRC
jgi:hypothetical protein